MAEVLLFHSVLGMRPGVAALADELRAAGHTVRTPDLFDGQVFDDYAAAFAHLEGLGGVDEVLRRARAATQSLPPELVYAGFSLGGMPAEMLASTRPGARGLLLLHAAAPLADFEMPSLRAWPAAVPVQVHFGIGDPYREAAELAGFTTDVQASGAPFQLYDYPVDGHLFTDATLPGEYDEAAAKSLLERVLAFLADLDRG